jgi:hypothetical protein
MRPRLVWRVLQPATALAFTAAAITLPCWQTWAGFAATWLETANGWREFARVEDDVIYRRGWWRWSKPLLLGSLVSVELHRVWGFREPYKHLELELVTIEGQRMSFSLRWWSRSDDLVRCIAAAAMDPAAYTPGRNLWRVRVDDETSKRLAAYI